MSKFQDFSISDSQACILICIIGFVLYFKSLFFGFTYLDDNVLILDHLPFLQNLGNIFASFVMDVFHVYNRSAAYYRPLLTISFMPEAFLSGAQPFFYHLINIIIHFSAACLVFKLLSKLNYSKIISFILSLMFLTHPVLTQAVAWVPGRNDSLLAVFILASFILFLDFIKTEKFYFAVLSSLFFLLALFTKESAAIMPFLCFAYVWFFERPKLRLVLKDVGPGWISSIFIWEILRYVALQGSTIGMSVKDMVSYIYFNSAGAFQLFGKVFFPFNLSVLPVIKDTTFIYGILSLLVIIVLFAIQAIGKTASIKSYYMMFFGLVWFVLFLLPALFRPNSSIDADFLEHRLYVPIIGIIFFLAESRLWNLLNTRYKNWCLAFFVFITIMFFSLTFFHQNNFFDRISFWKNAAENSPHSPLAQKNLGAMYYLEGNYELAENYYKKALALNESESLVHNNLGLIAANRGLFKEAEQEYLKELSINPLYDDGHFNFGLLYYKMGKLEEARKEWEKTLEINPDHGGARQMIDILNSEKK